MYFHLGLEHFKVQLCLLKIELNLKKYKNIILIKSIVGKKIRQYEKPNRY